MKILRHEKCLFNNKAVILTLKIWGEIHYFLIDSYSKRKPTKSSSVHAKLNALLLTSKLCLQNWRCVFSILELSQDLRPDFAYALQTSLLYVKTGEVIASKNFIP